MPIVTEIKLNDKELLYLKIARINKNIGNDPSQVNTYAVCLEKLEDWEIDYSELPIRFQHRYGDGVAVLVSRAIEAVRKHNPQYGEKCVN